MFWFHGGHSFVFSYKEIYFKFRNFCKLKIHGRIAKSYFAFASINRHDTKRKDEKTIARNKTIEFQI